MVVVQARRCGRRAFASTAVEALTSEVGQVSQPPAPEQVVEKEIAEWLRNDSGLPFTQIENLTLFMDTARATRLPEISTLITPNCTRPCTRPTSGCSRLRVLQITESRLPRPLISVRCRLSERPQHNDVQLAEIGRGGYSTLYRAVPASEDRNVTEPKQHAARSWEGVYARICCSSTKRQRHQGIQASRRFGRPPLRVQRLARRLTQTANS